MIGSGHDHPQLENYERAFAQVAGSEYAIAFGRGRHALLAILTAADLKAGDEVILSPITCKIIPLVLLSMGLRPVYVDVSRETLNLDPDAVYDAIGPRTSAILFMHLFGHSMGRDQVAQVARTHDLVFVEDCAHCMPGSTRRLPAMGNLNSSAVYTLNLGKPLSTGGGGVAITDSGVLASRIREVRRILPRQRSLSQLLDHASCYLQYISSDPWLWPRLSSFAKGFRSYYRTRPLKLEIAAEVSAKAARLGEQQLLAAFSGLSFADTIRAHRIAACAHYTEKMRTVEGVVMPRFDANEALFYFPVLSSYKRELLRVGRHRGIPLAPWPDSTPIFPVRDHSDLLKYGYDGSCPVAEQVVARLVGLPTYPLNTTRLERVLELVLSESYQHTRRVSTK